ncbi:hypothetical protein GH741_17885 [Aquibacillus halophilus]|uniref:DUF2154 domain-containing protein n=1 Tax=Aquibacillus halophilus TaxID=930132 RepID=A0A6A8DFP6_9BACI|nr:toast rack family protein [Aquibacillus halophilus]MRH44518.1 hypothetical protein [Aquibacillus halophilus]
MKKQLLLGCIVGFGLLTVVGCGSLNPINAVVGDIEKDEIVVKKDQATELEMELDLGAGEMHVTGGANDWITGEIEYNSSKLKPKVSYDLDGKTGKASIKQKKNVNLNVEFGEHKNRWYLQLTDDIPMDLQVDVGASDTKLDLRGIQLTELNLDAGVGDIEVDLSGDWQESFDATIHTGIGETTVILPKDVGVKVVSEKGIGTADFTGFISQGDNVYVNEAYETADVVIMVEAEMGIGEANFKLK